ncbi:AmmeMemoRadiSam system protein B [Candidatus Uabimicrobium amorphum]|uniref:MEMO1 family protein n=1 Tax=Uabimicrobium amorphum TaxID=2596890 RepID=A0A5S9IMH9_UABAM|nr:AmmeMemoRadiSam system protein B [Candidatus Uabimicrobium amorphum]BBM84071.1 MEMO1 family protein [Candidatus Uabimicrobium amorphum]
MHRQAAHAGFFYPQTKKQCEIMFERWKAQQNEIHSDGDICAGIAPHAGWMFSGYTAYQVFDALHRVVPDAKTFIVFGAIHIPGVFAPCTWGAGTWNTPLGDIEIAQEITEQLIENKIVEVNANAHMHEHSIEVLLPFIQHFFPQAKFVPIMVPVMSSANTLGKNIAQLVFGQQESNNTTIAICSTDLTHYGSRFGFNPAGSGHKSLEWVKNNNDKRIIDLMLQLQDAKIVEEVQKNQNACGGGAIAATLMFAKVAGRSQGKLLHYTTSWDVDPQGEIDNFVGYSGIVI